MCKGVSDFKQGYQLRINIVKVEIGDLVIDCHSILTTWRKNFFQLFNLQEYNVVTQRQIHTAEPLVPGPSAFEFEMAIEKLKRQKSSGIDQISAELIKTGGRTIRYEIHKPTNYIWNKEEFPVEWMQLIFVSIYKKDDKTECSNYRGITFLPNTYRILSNILMSRLLSYAEEIIGNYQCGFRRKSQLQITCSVFVKYLRKNGNTMKQCINYL